MREGLAPKLTAAILFLLAGVTIAVAFLQRCLPLSGPASVWDGPLEIAAEVSPLVFFSACVLVFFRPRLGYVLGLAAGLIGLPWFVRTEFMLSYWNSWIFLNYETPRVLKDGWAFPTFATLRILSVALIVIALACASLRLLPARWSLRGSPLRRRTWPAFAVGFLAVALWFARSVTPYSEPIFAHGMGAELRILHVLKRGLHFHETTVFAYRNGMVFVVQYDRQLFQYRLNGRAARAATDARIRPFVQSTGLWKLHTPVPGVLWSWNAEGWYVVLQDTRLLAFTSEYRTTPPKEITDLFQEMEKLPASQEDAFVLRDVCLGFCYDPVAALGFSNLELRARLLSRNASGAGPRF